MNDNDLYKNLTKREEQVLNLVLRGHSNKSMAKILSVTSHTIKAHLESIYRKFGVHNKVEAVIFAIVNQIVDVENLLPK